MTYTPTWIWDLKIRFQKYMNTQIIQKGLSATQFGLNRITLSRWTWPGTISPNSEKHNSYQRTVHIFFYLKEFRGEYEFPCHSLSFLAGKNESLAGKKGLSGKNNNWRGKIRLTGKKYFRRRIFSPVNYWLFSLLNNCLQNVEASSLWTYYRWFVKNSNVMVDVASKNCKILFQIKN